MSNKTAFHFIFGKIYSFYQQKRAEAALEELRPIVRRAEKLAYKAGFDGSQLLQECKSLQGSYELKLLNNSRIVRLLRSSSELSSKADTCSRYFGSVFFDLTSFSRPFSHRVIDCPNTDVKKATAKLLAAFIRTCQGRTMALQGRIEVLKYQEDLVNLWLEHPPTLPPTSDKAREKAEVFVYRGVSYSLNALDEILTYSAQAQHIASDMKKLVEAGAAQEHTGAQALTLVASGASNAKILGKIGSAPRCQKEQFAFEVLGTGMLIEARVARFLQCEQNLGNLTEEEFTRVLEARQRLGAAYIGCLQCSAVAYKAQIDSTTELIELAQALLVNVN